jgi:hypothetical protein
MTTGPPLLVPLPVPEEPPLPLPPDPLPLEVLPEPPPELLVVDPEEPPLLPPDPLPLPPSSPVGPADVEPPHAMAMAKPLPRNAVIRMVRVRMKLSSLMPLDPRRDAEPD